ncbi:antitoxin Xre-like helix-turn-helix domain-containing protein [Caballeronia novacaledonica]|uniref:DUF2384 domain-containing protein n=1 Tax=Caballeronia novacaledonica TaxID=1544861 RepID=A0AA37MI10_9BURK|nr:antitoxin Xre-like helix-turn-helix domain-containing protein [Caballeronia novacaledonica]GJH26983.1 DUF2384 domain-containing protein [Caballeronia novacaledonica]
MARKEIRVASERWAKTKTPVPVKRVSTKSAASEVKGPEKIQLKNLRMPFDILDFKKAYRSSSADRFLIIKTGVAARKVYDLATKLNVSQDLIIKRLGLSKSTISRKVQADQTLTADQSERVLGMSKLVGLVETIVEESGDLERSKDFDAAAWLENWLSQPNPALGGELPTMYLDTREGQEILSSLIAQMQSGAYA